MNTNFRVTRFPINTTEKCHCLKCDQRATRQVFIENQSGVLISSDLFCEAHGQRPDFDHIYDVQCCEPRCSLLPMLDVTGILKPSRLTSAHRAA